MEGKDDADDPLNQMWANYRKAKGALDTSIEANLDMKQVWEERANRQMKEGTIGIPEENVYGGVFRGPKETIEFDDLPSYTPQQYAAKIEQDRIEEERREQDKRLAKAMGRNVSSPTAAAVAESGDEVAMDDGDEHARPKDGYVDDGLVRKDGGVVDSDDRRLDEEARAKGYGKELDEIMTREDFVRYKTKTMDMLRTTLFNLSREDDKLPENEMDQAFLKDMEAEEAEEKARKEQRKMRYGELDVNATEPALEEEGGDAQKMTTTRRRRRKGLLADEDDDGDEDLDEESDLERKDYLDEGEYQENLDSLHNYTGTAERIEAEKKPEEVDDEDREFLEKIKIRKPEEDEREVELMRERRIMEATKLEEERLRRKLTEKEVREINQEEGSYIGPSRADMAAMDNTNYVEEERQKYRDQRRLIETDSDDKPFDWTNYTCTLCGTSKDVIRKWYLQVCRPCFRRRAEEVEFDRGEDPLLWCKIPLEGETDEWPEKPKPLKWDYWTAAEYAEADRRILAEERGEPYEPPPRDLMDLFQKDDASRFAEEAEGSDKAIDGIYY
eukprot:CAMPEP_0167802004 /NCGR_PEP_ID=MMETSP0111_2-20121227/18829_1 /TAXON_ID=91324 /ORGANISM="Lotharella globosa, Strain CCCM811" /LENGTH=556 /DNA_ID=CAMNT_0007697893 /DNA_START=27 /DNA_END=1697 /DNA_ORIENTATION=-